MPNRIFSDENRRKYVRFYIDRDRLAEILKIRFRIVLRNSEEAVTDWLDAEPEDISMGGMCLVIKDLEPQVWDKIDTQELEIEISTVLKSRDITTSSRAEVVWKYDRGMPGGSSRYMCGLRFTKINIVAFSAIVAYVQNTSLDMRFHLSVILRTAAAATGALWLIAAIFYLPYVFAPGFASEHSGMSTFAMIAWPMAVKALYGFLLAIAFAFFNVDILGRGARQGLRFGVMIGLLVMVPVNVFNLARFSPHTIVIVLGVVEAILGTIAAGVVIGHVHEDIIDKRRQVR